MAIFGPKPWVNPFEKTCIFQSFELLVFIAQKNVFSVQKKVKDIFLAYINEKRKKIGKMAIFQRFVLLFFIAQKGVFLFQNIAKDIFLAYIAKKKKLEKWPFLDQNHGLTPLEKCQLLHFLNFLFLQARKAFLRSRIS